MTPDELPADMEARTPAPEGEVVAWVNQTTLNAIKERPKEAAWVWGLPNGSINIPLYASPVVPVRVSREALLKAVRPVLDRHPMIDSSQSHKLDIQAGWVADAILAALRPTDTGWRDIATAPRDSTEVLVLVGRKVIRLGWYFKASSRTEGWCDENGNRIYPTHWMPLPAAPTDTGANHD